MFFELPDLIERALIALLGATLIFLHARRQYEVSSYPLDGSYAEALSSAPTSTLAGTRAFGRGRLIYIILFELVYSNLKIAILADTIRTQDYWTRIFPEFLVYLPVVWAILKFSDLTDGEQNTLGAKQMLGSCMFILLFCFAVTYSEFAVQSDANVYRRISEGIVKVGVPFFSLSAFTIALGLMQRRQRATPEE